MADPPISLGLGLELEQLSAYLPSPGFPLPNYNLLYNGNGEMAPSQELTGLEFWRGAIQVCILPFHPSLAAQLDLLRQKGW